MWFVMLLLALVMLVMAVTSGPGFWIATVVGAFVFWLLGGIDAVSTCLFGMFAMLLLLVAHGNHAAVDTLEMAVGGTLRWLFAGKKGETGSTRKDEGNDTRRRK